MPLEVFIVNCLIASWKYCSSFHLCFLLLSFYRFATHTSTQCSAMVTTATVNSSACPLVFETPTTNVTLPLQSQRSHCVTAINFPAPTSVSGSLLMSSTLCSTPRVLIHKPQSLSNPPSLIENPTTSITTVSPSKMSTSDSSFTNLSNPAIIFHDQVNTQSPQTSKSNYICLVFPLISTDFNFFGLRNLTIMSLNMGLNVYRVSDAP